MMMNQPKQRFLGLEWVRALAAFGIVGCHLDLANLSWGAQWLKQFTDLNVGVFAVIAGFFSVFAVSRAESWGVYASHRLRRLLPPYILWSVLYISVDIFFDTFSGKPLTFQPTRWQYWHSVLFMGSGAAHLWFLPALLYTQLVAYPIIKKAMGGRAWVVWLIGGGGFLLVSCCPLLAGWSGRYLWRLVGFFAIGVMFALRVGIIEKISPRLALLGVLVGSIMIGAGWQHGFIGTCVLIIPLVVFGIVWHPGESALVSWGTELGRLSFCVYLTHVFFTIALREVVLRLGLPHNAMVYLTDWIMAWTAALCFSLIGARCIPKFSLLGLLLPMR